jgi:hypothetical protein
VAELLAVARRLLVAGLEETRHMLEGLAAVRGMDAASAGG